MSINFKETFKKAIKGTIDFARKHPTATKYILAGGIVVGCAAIAAIRAKKGKLRWEELDVETGVNLKESEEDIWNREYKETYDKVVEFFENISLKPGEMYIIEDQTQFIGEEDIYLGVDLTKPIVSHLVFGMGVYPPGE